MSNLTQTEENHLKAIFKLTERESDPAGTNNIARELATTAASVTDMLKRLAKKGLIDYVPRRGCTLTAKGQTIATHLVRKHRLCETFLVDKLDFSWDEVHEIAEQLEHIQSPELVERLSAFLGHPRFDPHGDPIPDADGRMLDRIQVALNQLEINLSAVVVGVREHEPAFLQFLDRSGLGLGAAFTLKDRSEYDKSLILSLKDGREITVSQKVGRNLLVQAQN